MRLTRTFPFRRTPNVLLRLGNRVCRIGGNATLLHIRSFCPTFPSQSVSASPSL